jgi:hypothetical protein
MVLVAVVVLALLVLLELLRVVEMGVVDYLQQFLEHQ